jgi:hypothetical protein
VSPFLGYVIISKNHNGPTKSSLIVEKFAQSGHPSGNKRTSLFVFSILSEKSRRIDAQVGGLEAG